ncbi:methylated-DNA--[protein]-cysteine S-methyltransferase [Paenibacillus xylaniclasticus]|uniref:methylated-DNA--[protein]-cysteine S-methyltransferase n=1 Tax=Paenibacillus xylaniclasticus TaxID=588083 RepID=UPI000FDB43A3|nr:MULTISPECIES: methylated-DNA--[protein]-cysteine S-methyltransferase [Paenibacillus]GFN30271.1 methylated-DNA--protein-cysteine methyltransferase, inducible [Paenibacillus curdlanolyticus]
MAKTITKAPLYWSIISYDSWNLYLAATADGLCFVGSNGHPFNELLQWAAARMPGSELLRDDNRLQPYINQFSEYFAGKRRDFTFPLDCSGTPFQRAVWDALCRIPYGHTASYSDIAVKVSRPSATRAVGSAIGANPVLITVPCHRVIGKNGTLTGYRGGLTMKRVLLQHEQNVSAAESIHTTSLLVADQ